MNITAISDLHGYLPDINPCDLLAIAGDISPLYIQRDKELMDLWIKNEFKKWVMELPCTRVVLVAGNHDFYLQWIDKEGKERELEEIFEGKLTYLCNELRLIEIANEVITVFGTPYCHMFGTWPYMLQNDELAKKFKDVPEHVDLLITHDPPFALGDTDVVLQESVIRNKGHLGNKPLIDRLDYLYSINGLPACLVCGHIHSGEHGVSNYYGMKFANVSYLDERYKPVYKPLEFELQ